MSTRAETWKSMRDEVKSCAHKLGISQTRVGLSFVLSMISECCDELFPDDKNPEKFGHTAAGRAADFATWMRNPFLETERELREEFAMLYYAVGMICTLRTGNRKWFQEAFDTIKYVLNGGSCSPSAKMVVLEDFGETILLPPVAKALGAEATALYIQTVGPAPLGPSSEMEL